MNQKPLFNNEAPERSQSSDLENFDSSMRCIKPSRKSQTGHVGKRDVSDRSSYQQPAAVGIGGGLAEVSEDQEEQKFSRDS